jgi:ATP/maltotriose-dependent transcriptional regulator MalT
MPHGKAVSLPLTKIERRALENLRYFLEEQLDDYNKRFSNMTIRGRIFVSRDESNYLPLLKLKAILLAADGNSNQNIANQLEISAHTVGK